MRKFFLFIFLSFSLFAFTQSKVTKMLLSNSFNQTKQPEQAKKSFLNTNKRKYNPINYIGGAFIFFYQNVFSEQIQANCAYEISCSNYTKKCMETKGPIKGFLLGIHQLSCCFGGIEDDYEIISITAEGKVNNLSTE
ncbi:MAG: membrane protein insertion efficiency factor YidD [Bacteroidota bacterium]